MLNIEGNSQRVDMYRLSIVSQMSLKNMVIDNCYSHNL